MNCSELNVPLFRLSPTARTGSVRYLPHVPESVSGRFEQTNRRVVNGFGGQLAGRPHERLQHRSSRRSRWCENRTESAILVISTAVPLHGL